jgi:sec-independent protein translocase protein TatA
MLKYSPCIIFKTLKKFDMGSFGWQEILLIAVVILILFGARKIPEFMKGLGRGMREFNDAKDGARKELEDEEANKTVTTNTKAEQTTKE